jgi:hypothetical protein
MGSYINTTRSSQKSVSAHEEDDEDTEPLGIPAFQGPWDLWIDVDPKRGEKSACECGAEIAKTTHTYWCPLYRPTK